MENIIIMIINSHWIPTRMSYLILSMARSSGECYPPLRERKTGTRKVKLPKVGVDKKWSRELQRARPYACIRFGA